MRKLQSEGIHHVTLVGADQQISQRLLIFSSAPRVDLRRYRLLRMFQPLIPESQEARHGGQRLAQLPCRVTPSQQLKHYCARCGLD
jgi:hypothetical protein